VTCCPYSVYIKREKREGERKRSKRFVVRFWSVSRGRGEREEEVEISREEQEGEREDVNSKSDFTSMTLD
jgi:hypothetical protein